MIGGDEPPTWDIWLGTLPLLTEDNWPERESFVVFDGTAGTYQTPGGDHGVYERPILVARTANGVKQIGVAVGPVHASTYHERYYYSTTSHAIEYYIAKVHGVLDDVKRKSGLQDVETFTATAVTGIQRSEVHLKLLSLYS